MRYAMLSVALLAVAGAGCYERMDIPANFVGVEAADAGEYEMRCISADGVVAGLEVEENAKNGTLEFWREAIEANLTGRGYRLAASEDVTGRSGTAGAMMTFSTSRHGVEVTYIVTVYVKSGAVLVAQAGGKAAAVKKHLPAIRKALLSAG
jgi:hypothetical protein